MAKTHKENVDSETLPKEPWSFPPLPDGILIRLLNEDDENGAISAILDFPAGWSWSGPAVNRGPQEFFVLDGSFVMGEHRMTNGYYSYYPEGCVQGAWTAESDCSIYALFDARPEFRAADASLDGARTSDIIYSLNTWDLEWINPLEVTSPDMPFRPGAFVKPLRVDEKTKASTYIAGLMPGWYQEGVEEHPVGEEEFTLGGDLLLGEIAGGYSLKKGSYFCRPPGNRHGPLVSKNGIVIVCHPTGVLTINYHTNPNAKQMVDDYFEKTPWK